jgi:hypothetical protein
MILAQVLGRATGRRSKAKFPEPRFVQRMSPGVALNRPRVMSARRSLPAGERTISA